jgi:hypothetical protein
MVSTRDLQKDEKRERLRENWMMAEWKERLRDPRRVRWMVEKTEM